MCPAGGAAGQAAARLRSEQQMAHALSLSTAAGRYNGQLAIRVRLAALGVRYVDAAEHEAEPRSEPVQVEAVPDAERQRRGLQCATSEHSSVVCGFANSKSRLFSLVFPFLEWGIGTRTFTAAAEAWAETETAPARCWLRRVGQRAEDSLADPAFAGAERHIPILACSLAGPAAAEGRAQAGACRAIIARVCAATRVPGARGGPSRGSDFGFVGSRLGSSREAEAARNAAGRCRSATTPRSCGLRARDCCEKCPNQGELA